MNDLTCIHSQSGLCGLCRADYEEDGIAFLEFGPHPAGARNAEALAAELAAREPDGGGATGPDVPL